LLVEQTKARITKDLATKNIETGDEAVIVDGIFNWTSQKECSISYKRTEFEVIL
jgi:hypothetical protein